jgi:hypothetical protein
VQSVLYWLSIRFIQRHCRELRQYAFELQELERICKHLSSRNVRYYPSIILGSLRKATVFLINEVSVWCKDLEVSLNVRSSTVEQNSLSILDHICFRCYALWLWMLFYQIWNSNNLIGWEHYRRSQWQGRLRHELSSLARTLGSWVRTPFKSWMSVCAFILCLCYPVCR